MSKFKVGDLAWSPRHGFQVLKNGPTLYDPSTLVHANIFYSSEGRYHSTDTHPTLLTVEEAAKLGYFPEKKKVKKRLYHALIKSDHTDELFVNAQVFETEHMARIGYGQNFVKLLDDGSYPSVEVEVEE